MNNIVFNPHGNGTHTESVGHISKEDYPINDCLQNFFFIAELISVKPESIGSDLIITKKQIEQKLGTKMPEALVIRSLPNGMDKMNRQYSGTNPAYLEAEAAKFISDHGIEHLLLDLPSVDKEEDGGALSAHHEFWKYPVSPRKSSTITELIYVPEHILDGTYLLNIQIASFVNDASPSKPLLFNFFKP